MGKPLDFAAPSASSAHLALRKAIADAGFAQDHFRDLLWLLNAHPDLIAHAQVFGNVSRLLSSRVFSADALQWASDWKHQVSAWAAITRWLWEHTHSLEKIPELAKTYHLDRRDVPPDSAYEHPITRRGMVRHAIVAAMWTIHHSSSHGTESNNEAGQVVSWSRPPRYLLIRPDEVMSIIRANFVETLQSFG